jgi:hypothetical protein
VPDLEQMDEHQVLHFLAELFSDLSTEAEYNVRHEDYVMEMPQSGEHIRGREKMRQLQEDYPAPPTIQLRRVVLERARGILMYSLGEPSMIVCT